MARWGVYTNILNHFVTYTEEFYDDEAIRAVEALTDE